MLWFLLWSSQQLRLKAAACTLATALHRQADCSCLQLLVIAPSLICCIGRAGRNSVGQLGVGGTADVHEPSTLQVLDLIHCSCVSLLVALNITYTWLVQGFAVFVRGVLQVVRQWAAISFGEGHAAGVSGEGEVFTWGKNDLGQVGQNVGHDKNVPTKMEILKGWDVRALACGAHHTVALTPEDVISWGANSEGQCGQGERAETLWVKPRSIKPLQGMYVSQVVCGKYHTLCVTATSQVRNVHLSICDRASCMLILTPSVSMCMWMRLLAVLLLHASYLFWANLLFQKARKADVVVYMCNSLSRRQRRAAA